MAGVHDIVIAAGVEVMSLVPMGASFGQGVGFPFGPRVDARYKDAGGLIPQGLSAELIAEQWNLSREELDAFSAESQQRAARARDEGRFDREIHPVEVRRRDKDSGEIIPTDGVLRTFQGMLNAGGVLCIGDLDSEDGSFHDPGEKVHHGFDRAALTRQAEAAGFRNVRFDDVCALSKKGREYPMFLMTAERAG